VSRPGRRGIGSVQQLIDLVRCLARHSTRVCVSPGGDARAARPLAAVEPAWVRKTPTGGNRRARCALPARLWDANSAEIRRPIRRLPDRPRNLPTVLRPDSGVLVLRKELWHRHISAYRYAALFDPAVFGV
jgi:hypothetical protein